MARIRSNQVAQECTGQIFPQMHVTQLTSAYSQGAMVHLPRTTINEMTIVDVIANSDDPRLNELKEENPSLGQVDITVEFLRSILESLHLRRGSLTKGELAKRVYVALAIRPEVQQYDLEAAASSRHQRKSAFVTSWMCHSC
eukprot:358547-Chlamydomonas_euryale.AAC.1